MGSECILDMWLANTDFSGIERRRDTFYIYIFLCYGVWTCYVIQITKIFSLDLLSNINFNDIEFDLLSNTDFKDI